MRHGLLCFIVVSGFVCLPVGGCKKKAVSAVPTTTAEDPNGGGLRPPGVGGGVAKMFPSVQRASAGNDLRQIALYYKGFETSGRAPSKLDDLPDLKRDMPKVYQAIEDGIYIVYWNAAPSTPGSSILAHVRDTPKKGGVVVRYDGSIDNVTVEQFETAAKVGK